MQRWLIVLGLVIVAVAVGFVIFRVRQPAPPPPPDAAVLVPGKALGPFAVGMSRAEAEAKKKTNKFQDDPTLVAEFPFVARLRDDRVVTVTAAVPDVGLSLNGHWIRPALHAADSARELAKLLGNCVAHRQERQGEGGWYGPWFDCHGTKIEADEGREQLTITVGAY
jgi:hypothetical protein